MTLQFLGKDPESEYNGSPTVWDDGDCYVIQGWRGEAITGSRSYWKNGRCGPGSAAPR